MIEAIQFIHSLQPWEFDFNDAIFGLRLQDGVAPFHNSAGYDLPFQIIPNSPTSMHVIANPGHAWLRVGSTSWPGETFTHTYNDAGHGVAINISHSSLPRIDSVYLKSNPTTGQGQLEYVPGTATAGATLDNRTGAGTSSEVTSILLADILVASGVGSIEAAAIRDRRPWAYGACSLLTGAGATTQTFTTTTQTDIGTATKRLELHAGARLNVSMSAQLSFPASAAGLGINLGLAWTGPATGVRTTRFSTLSATAASDWAQASHDITFPVGGSYLFRPVALLTAANATGVIVHNNPASPVPPLTMMLREIVVQR